MADVEREWLKRSWILLIVMRRSERDMMANSALRHMNTEISVEASGRIDAGIESSSDKKRPHIITILPRGEAIRNFVYTGALDEVARNMDVSLLSVIPSDDLQNQFLSRYHDLHQLQEIRESHIVEALREILDMAHGRWLWSEAAQERWRLRDVEAETIGQRLKREAKKMACLPFSNKPGLDLLTKVERLASRRLQTTDHYIKLFQEAKPSLVFNGSHVHSRVALQAVQAAQWLGIPTATFIFSWDNLTSQGRIIPLYDYYIVWNDALRDQLLDLYTSIKPEQVFVTGTPQFDFHFREEFYWSREEFCERVGADPARPIILYSTGMANHMPGEPLIVEQIAAMLREMTDLGPPQLLVRVYPKDLTGRFDYLKKSSPDILFPAVPWESAWLTPKMEDAYLLTNTLRHVAAGINVASTISLELCMFDKPVLNVGFNPPDISKSLVDYSRYYQFDHYRPVVESGAVEVAYSSEELRRSLVESLVHPEKGREQRKSLIRQFFQNSLDGWSSSRVASVLEMLASGNNASSLHWVPETVDSALDYLKS